MNSFNLLRKCCRIFIHPCVRTKITNFKPKLPTFKHLLPTSMLFGSFFVSNGGNKKIEPVKNYAKEIKSSCIGSEKKINELILTLGDAITETCEKYRTCLKRQIEVMDKGLQIDPLDQYWDCLVPLRVEADNLKKDFESYRCMIEYVGQLAFNLAFCSALMSNLDSKDYVCEEYFKLEKIAKEQVAENKKLEEALLQQNMQSIINTSNTVKDLQDIASELKKNIDNCKESQERLARNKINLK